ncbi:MAG: family 16 glycoside hydrolase, partial [Planctomycetota bacterium]
GVIDQGGGPIWRCRDKDNYYIARWNPLEDNFRVYFVKKGRRRQLASADVKANPKLWHQIKIEHRENRIKAFFDGKKIIEVGNSTFTKAGRIGLWTKADAATSFDRLKVATQWKD